MSDVPTAPYPCRRCGRYPTGKYGFCTVCVDWWEELLGLARDNGIEWDPENTTQQSLGEFS